MFAHINTLDEIKGRNPQQNQVSIFPLFDDIKIKGFKQFSNHIPGRIRVSDWNNDGYPDVIVTVEHLNDTSQVIIFLNKECNEAHANDTCNK